MANEEQAAPKKSLLVPILVVTNALSIAGVAAVYFLGTPAPQEASAKEEEEGADAPEGEDSPFPAAAEFGIPVDMGSFTINLADADGPRYLKVVVKVTVSAEETEEEVKYREAQMRDVVISYLSSLTLDDTKGARAKEDLRESLRKRMNNLLRSGEVMDVFFTEFVTQ